MVQVMREFDLVSRLKGSLKDTRSILDLVRPASRQLLWIFVGSRPGVAPVPFHPKW